jgi:hypothetical protein
MRQQKVVPTWCTGNGSDGGDSRLRLQDGRDLAYRRNQAGVSTASSWILPLTGDGRIVGNPTMIR